MKKLSYKAICFAMVALFYAGCNKEKTPEAIWQYPGPDPAIADGPSQAQKLCYELFQKYDMRIYYDFSGSSVRTDAGWLQTNTIASSRPAAIPLQPADEISAEVFLMMLKNFFSVLPDDKVASLGVHRRIVLAKINPGAGSTTLLDEDGNRILICSHTENQQGIILYGYLMTNEDTNNSLLNDPKMWTWNICYRYFLGSADTYQKRDFIMPPEFIRTSTGLYNQTSGANAFFVGGVYNHEVGKRCGFVHPYGGTTNEDYPEPDWASYVAWIVTRPYNQRATDIAANPRIKEKYDIVLDYYKTNHNMDLEAISVKYCALTL